MLLIALFGLILRLIFFSGMGISDSLTYSKTANDLNAGKGIDPESTLTLSTRLGLVYATAFSYKIFGINDFSSVLFPLLTSIASIILIFYFGKLLFNKKTGLMAAFLLSFFPLEVVYSTQLLSDLPSMFFMSLGVYIFLYAELKSKLKYGLCYLLAGVFIGIGYMIRESALLIALFFIAYIIYKKKIKKEYFLVPLGVILVFALESLIFFSLTNDALFRFNASQKYLRESVIAHNYFGRLDFPTGLFHYPWLFLTNNLLAFFYIPVFVSALYLFFYRRKESILLLLWLIPLLLYLSFGSSSLTEYLPFKAADRYTEIFTIPAIMLLAFFLAEKDIFVKKWVAPLIMAFLLVSSAAAVYMREDRSLLAGLKELHTFI
ncbi:MAG: glycosyltransferase family 39 protein, partial [Nanoarchaeota archaeon]